MNKIISPFIEFILYIKIVIVNVPSICYCFIGCYLIWLSNLNITSRKYNNRNIKSSVSYLERNIYNSIEDITNSTNGSTVLWFWNNANVNLIYFSLIFQFMSEILMPFENSLRYFSGAFTTTFFTLLLVSVNPVVLFFHLQCLDFLTILFFSECISSVVNRNKQALDSV